MKKLDCFYIDMETFEVKPISYRLEVDENKSFTVKDADGNTVEKEAFEEEVPGVSEVLENHSDDENFMTELLMLKYGLAWISE